MSTSTVLVVTWVLAGLVVGLYVWFVVWRVRVDRRKKAGEVDDATRMSSAIDKAARLSAELDAERPPVIAPPTGAVAAAPAAVPGASEATVAGALAGISLPNDLAPLTTMTDRPGVGDRVAFWTDTAPADVVGRAFEHELERLGYAVSTTDAHSLSAQRDGLWVRT